MICLFTLNVNVVISLAPKCLQQLNKIVNLWNLVRIYKIVEFLITHTESKHNEREKEREIEKTLLN